MATENGYRIGFIGAGRMATALACGLSRAGLAELLLAADVVPAARERFAAETGGTAVESNIEVAAQADVLFLAVKPQHMDEVLAELSGRMESRHLVISIAAGVPLARLEAGLGAQSRVVRVMPNTPCLVGASASAFALGQGAPAEDAATVMRLLSSVGIAYEVPEKLLDAVTGLSGSGPAFVYVMIEAMADGGVRMGLPRDVAVQLAAQTVFGSAKMVLELGEHPAALKDGVASPGGTTIAGLHALENGGFRGIVMSAVESAARRSEELGQSS